MRSVFYSILAVTLLVFYHFTPAFSEPISGEEEILAEQNITDLYVFGARRGPALGRLSKNVSIFSELDFRESPARTVDEFLQSYPEFSLFRRTSSLTGHPTTQGAALRGIKPSGTSRVLVLLNGVPLNDPFGGWILWQRLPLHSIERIELYRGSSAHIWGNYALSGAINIVTRDPVATAVRAGALTGSHQTYGADIAADSSLGPLGIGLSADTFRSDGYHVLRSSQRGLIDERASLESYNLGLKAVLAAGEFSRLFLSAGNFYESRGNGTPLTENRSRGKLFQGGGVFTLPGFSILTVSAFYREEDFSSTFSSQSPDRSFEVPALDQYEVPSDTYGMSFDYLIENKRHVFTAGADFQKISSHTAENFRFLDGAFLNDRKAGGNQRLFGAFAQDVYSITDSLRLTVGGRVDYWENFDAFRREKEILSDDILRDDMFEARRRTFLNPSSSLAYDFSSYFTLEGSIYRSTRAPNLNELFRPFRVRNDITEANPELSPERLEGIELILSYEKDGINFSTGAFINRLKNAIANVTRGVGPGFVEPCGFVPEGGRCSQRMNLEQTRVTGFSIEGRYQLSPRWEFSLNYLLNSGRIETASDDPELEGNRLAQVPRHSSSAALLFSHPDLLNLKVEGSYWGSQFEDDRNTLKLSDAFVLNASVEREFGERLSWYVDVTNLLNERIESAKTSEGLISLAAPLRVIAGLRTEF